MNNLRDGKVIARQKSTILSEIDFLSLYPMRLGRIRYIGLHSFWLSFLALFAFSFKMLGENRAFLLFSVPFLLLLPLTSGFYQLDVYMISI
jgi:hypothetical protein